MRFAFIKCHGSGNDFPLIDARTLTLPDAQWAGVARALADRDGPVGGDGLLLLTAGDEDAPFGMRMFNPDGSEAETCLNGLRCTARLGFELTGLNEAEMKLATSHAFAARAEEIAPGVVSIETRAGPARVGPQAIGLAGVTGDGVDATVPGLPSERRFTMVAMPNPHLVAFVEQVDEAELVALGDWCEGAPSLVPQRANVSFVELREGGLFVRTYERGVGLTNSCGSAMAASTHAAGLTGRVPFGRRVTVFNRGGRVLAEAAAPDAGGLVTIIGNATFLYDAEITVDPETGAVSDLIRHARRIEEAEAWTAAIDRAA